VYFSLPNLARLQGGDVTKQIKLYADIAGNYFTAGQYPVIVIDTDFQLA
jgi:hypothetical protein